jgi:hypothetical protein
MFDTTETPKTPVSEAIRRKTKGLTSEEMNAFMEGLAFYLSSDLPEEEKMALALKKTQDNLTEPESIVTNKEVPPV